MRRESPKQIAWIRIINIDAEVLAQTGSPLSGLPTAEQLRTQMPPHQSRREMIKSPAGDILVVDSRLRFFGRPGEPPPPGAFRGPREGPPHDGGPMFSEIGIYVEGVTVNFGALRQNLIIGCLAAIALLVSMAMIGLMFNRYIRARQLEQQLELARSVQNDLLPALQGVNFAAAFLPAATVGGDFYDVFSTDDAPVSLVLGDVAGKGISAALLMGVLHGAIRSMRWTRSAADQEEASQWLNRFLCEKTARERFVSLFWAYFLPETGMLRYVNAGHLPPLLIRIQSNGETVERLEAGGPVLGLLPAAQYCSGTAKVEPGDVLVVFSDGVCEAANIHDEEFGDARIAEIVRRNIELSPQEICDAILREVAQFLGTMKPHDDQTLLVVRLVPATKQDVSSSSCQESSLPLIG
jgi:serine phosphatase RsbU (regulator of sigma subunit)